MSEGKVDNPKAKKTKSPKKPKQKKVTMRDVTDWIYEYYEVKFLPKHFFIHLAEIPKGKYPGLRQAVPYEDLLDMWKQKASYLDKVNLKNRQKGKVIEGMARINYDISILLSRYDSYLAWKSEQEAEQKAREAESKKEKINYANINAFANDNKKANAETSESKEDSLLEVLDEILGGD